MSHPLLGGYWGYLVHSTLKHNYHDESPHHSRRVVDDVVQEIEQALKDVFGDGVVIPFVLFLQSRSFILEFLLL